MAPSGACWLIRSKSRSPENHASSRRKNARDMRSVNEPAFSLKHIQRQTASERSVEPVGNQEGLCPFVPQDETGEGVNAHIHCGEGIVPGKRRAGVGALEGHCSGVAGRDVAVSV